MNKNKLITGALVLAVAGIICKVLGAVYRVPLAAIIGTTGMANYQIAFPVYSLLLVISSSGIPIAISKIVSQSVAEGNFGAVRKVFRVSLVSLLVLGFISSLVMLVFAAPIAAALGLPEADLSIVSIAPALFFAATVSAFRGYFQGLMSMQVTAVSQIIEQAVKLTLGIYLAFLLSPYGARFGAAGALIGVSISEAAGLVYAIIMYFAKGKSMIPACRGNIIRRPGDNLAVLKRIAAIALPVTVGACIAPIISAVDSATVINILKQTGHTANEASAMFGVLTGYVFPLAAMPSVVSIALCVSVVPSMTAAITRGEVTSARRQSSLVMKIALLVGIPSAILAFVFAEEALLLLYPSLTSAELGLAVLLLKIMSPGILLIMLLQTMTGIFQGFSKPYLPVLALAVGAVTKIALSESLIRVQQLGVAGAAISTVACYLVAACLDIVMLRREQKIGQTAKSVIKPALGLCFLLIACTYFSVGVVLTLLAGIIGYVILVFATRALSTDELGLLKGNNSNNERNFFKTAVKRR